jgi:hypothetical protein
MKSGQMVTVIRCKQHKGTFCDRYGTAFYDLKTPEEKVQRAIQQSLEGMCPAVSPSVERLLIRKCSFSRVTTIFAGGTAH